MIDSHTHLHLCEGDEQAVVAAAATVGVSRMVTVGTRADSNRLALASAARFDGVYAAVGHHPNDATGFTDADLEELRALAAHPRCVAIGETGLDYFRTRASEQDQKRAFRAQIELARESGKPLVVHTRAADDDTISILSEHADGLQVILHCFSMADRVDECLGHPDWWFSFAGNVTYPNAKSLRVAALRVPAGRLLVETDAPYLTPQPMRGSKNAPANVVLTAEALAVERRVPYEELDRSIEANAAAVFGW
jgi:TatD DNase family protein